MHVLARRRMRPCSWQIRIPEETSWRHVLGASNYLEGMITMTVNRDDYQAAFSKRLKQTIQAKDMKYLEVANKADVGLNAVSKWANGCALPTVFTFAKLCVAMKLDARTICALLGVNAK